MDLIERFQEITGISPKETAEEILQQFNWNIESAVQFFFGDDSAQMDIESSSCSPLPESFHRSRARLLNFAITFSSDSSKNESLKISLENILDSITLGELKKKFVNKCLPQLTQLAETYGLSTDVAALTAALRFDGMLNSSNLNNHVTLKSLHLPTNNTWIARFMKRQKIRPYSVRESPSAASSSHSSHPLDLRIRVPGHSHSRNGATNTRSSGGKVIHLRSIYEDTSLASLKNVAAKESGIVSENQIWSLQECDIQHPKVDRLLKDLNGDSEFADRTLLHYNLRNDRPYTFVITNVSAPSCSQPSSSSGRVHRPNEDRRPRKAKKKIHYDDGDDDQGVDDDYILYSDVDELSTVPLDVSDLHSSHCVPLIPSNLINTASEALEHFYQVFIQRYCVGPESVIPPFLLCSFTDAFAQCFNTNSVADRKPLFIYLHNDRSVAAHIFCSRLLCSQEMGQFMEVNQLHIWPWDVTLEDARARLIHWLTPRLEYLVNEVSRLQTDDYPLFIMLCKLGGSYEVITILTGNGFSNRTTWPTLTDDDIPAEAFPPLGGLLSSTSQMTLPHKDSHSTARGRLDPKDVVGELWQKYLMYQERLQPEVQADTQRAERELMRQEQDRAYRESLAQDRLKRELKKREAEEEARREEEAHKQAEADRIAARNRQVAAADALPTEPSLTGEEGNVATLRFRLPTDQPLPPAYEYVPKADQLPIQNGMITRRFRADETLSDLKNFMESLGYLVDEYKLLTTFPRVDLTANSSDDETLANLKLVPQETLNLEQR